MAHQKKNLTKKKVAQVAQVALPKKTWPKKIRGVSGANGTQEKKLDQKKSGVSGAVALPKKTWPKKSGVSGAVALQKKTWPKKIRGVSGANGTPEKN